MLKERDTISTIGLDLGRRHINMVKLSSGPDGWKLLDFGSVALNARESKDEKASRLQEIVQEKGIAALPVNIGVCGESVIVRYLDLPRMKREEVAQALKFEAQQYIPFKMEEIIFDYHILEPLDSDRQRMKVLLVAAKKQIVMEFVELIRRVGLKTNFIDVNSFSLINCFQSNGPDVNENDIYALVNLEFDMVNINILQGTAPFFTRDISLLEESRSLGQEQGSQDQFLEAMRPLLINLIRELRLSIDYFESEFEKQVAIIYFSGDGARFPELIDFFTSQLGREIKLWNPVQKLITEPAQIDTDALRQIECTLALACGLALRR
ncbi:MAG: type IV pilus assembly protein PilM [Omnitrophica bacterium]|nr:type IV pilus assembly protein PilM [Candidatus Omnitrophota bacterium]